MKNSTLLLILIFSVSLNAQIDSSEAYNDSKLYQSELNESYASATESPLDSTDLYEFTALPFYPISDDFIVEASLVKYKKKKKEIFETSTSRMPEYNIYGKLFFQINGEDFELTVYQNPSYKKDGAYKNYLFLPFTDLTNGETSYGGGRYLDFWIPDSEMVILNFNKSYNPYCAYSDRYSCPIPPKSNFLDIEIKAGVMLLEQH